MDDSSPLLRLTEYGLYCEAGGFYIDPWHPVDRAVVTHAHSDHARWGCDRYLTTRAGLGVLRTRMGPDAIIDALEYGETTSINGVAVSLHPAGHILGSAQARVEHRGKVWVVSGDYKTGPDATCAAFEPVRCHAFITESTFGLPIYRWSPQQEVFDAINAWWRSSAESGKTSMLYGYSLGKAQRLLSGLDPTIGPIFCHGAVEKLNQVYREGGIALPPTAHAGTASHRSAWARALIVAPPSAHGSPWARKFGPSSSAFASGWMAIRGPRRRRAVDRGFVLSDHADWPGLLSAIDATGAETVLTTHGYSAILARWLREQGKESHPIATRFTGERDDEEDEANPSDQPQPDTTTTGEVDADSIDPDSDSEPRSEGTA